MKHSTKLRRRSEAQIQALLSLQEKQGIKVTAFCKAQKIHKATFYNWRNKYGGGIKNGQGFIPVHFAEPATPAAALFAEIELPSKVCIRLFERVDATYFKPLFQS
ncbi:MAG: transposase [Actinomycetota bacterium]|nr:transposase [Actinomycetota bacterium]